MGKIVDNFVNNFKKKLSKLKMWIKEKNNKNNKKLLTY